MSIKRRIAAVLLVIMAVLLNLAILCHKDEAVKPVTMHFSVSADQAAYVTVYYSADEFFEESSKEVVLYSEVGEVQELTVNILSDTEYMRIDFDDKAHSITVSDMYFAYGDITQEVDMTYFQKEHLLETHEIMEYSVMDDSIVVAASENDPFVAVQCGPSEIADDIMQDHQKNTMIKNILVVFVLDLACVVALCFRKKFFGLPIELYQNRALILNLAKNDFKTRFAGSYLGIVWAFVQPIVTVLVYWFVFQVGLRSGNVQDYPFVLWLVAGLVPWFFFQEALNGGTNALIEYSYLVKKVVFKISTLPLVKVISALFVHAFFVLFTLILYCAYGYFPDLYTLQIIYYSFALFVFVLGICYTTCAVVIFFRDLSQIINIVLQVGVWITPIMWNIEDMGQRMPRVLVLIMKANPLYYIVNGYRDALLNKVWFWERFDLTCLYWLVTAAVFAVGAVIFKRLKVHFADIL